MIRIDDLDFSHAGGGFRLHVPQLNVAQGEKVAVVGPSGTGKTTLLHLLAGLLTPQSGTVQVDGTPVPHLSDAARRRFRINRIGFIFQNFELIDYLSAGENILYPYRVTDALRLDASVRARATALAEAVGLGHRLGSKPAALSQGEKQRIAICRALVTQPALLLADEATGNLDPENKQMILDLLFTQAEAAGATLLAVTHDHALLPRFDRVIDFNDFRSKAGAGA
ncbi:ABC transporter ATP-binding protein [Oceanibium sediminis]|uniref:ABC transporter ATP-binding protein n=1 Tax=Oceanibium sediminis TaxID=2026339 RepID=UPI000DD3CC7E|nr:ATP-binding cassette domain-containing protein [Oceanibium sediminis]